MDPVFDGPRDPEIENLHPTVGSDHDVFGFEVAVHDPLAMGGGQGHGDLFGDFERAPPIDEAFIHLLLEGAPFDELEDQEIGLLAFDQIVDLADRRVLEFGQDAGFAQETRLHLRIEAVLRADGFHRHPAIEPGVVSKVDLPHAAGPEAGLQTDIAHMGADERVVDHRLHGATLTDPARERENRPYGSRGRMNAP